MSSKLLGIFDGIYHRHWGAKEVEEGIGGSETWSYEVAKEFVKRGYEVRLYAYPKENGYTDDGINLLHFKELDKDIRSGIRFDYFIYSRQSDLVNPYLKCDNVYIMCHDVDFLHYRFLSISTGRVKRYGYLSEWHKNNLLNQNKKYGLYEDLLVKVTNGCSEYYNEIPKKKDSLVWSSSLARGFFDVYKLVLWPILKTRKLEIHVCYGTDLSKDKELAERASMLPGVIMHNVLPKKELANLQLKSKIWVYPGSFPETFCITAVENGKAGNALICPLTYGLETTLKGYNTPINGILDENNANQYIETIIKCLDNEEYRLSLVNQTLNICNQYSWKRVVDEWEAILSDESIPSSLTLKDWND